MEDNTETLKENKSVNKAKSYYGGPSLKLRSELAKRKSFNVNEAVRSVDMALGRLKKSKLVDGQYTSNTAHTSPVRHGLASTHMFIDSLTEPNYNHGVDSASMMSMNFSHYELMRNLSCSNCNIDGAFSSSTCSTYSPSDLMLKNENLERFFCSAEMWNRDCANNESGTSNSTTHLKLPDE